MRPAGHVRIAILEALKAGAVGTFDALASHTSLPEQKVRQTLGNLRREGRVAAIRPQVAPGAQPQRVRAIYAPAANDGPPFDVLRFAGQVWR